MIGVVYMARTWTPCTPVGAVRSDHDAIFLATLLAAYFLSAKLQRLISEPILQLVKTARAVTSNGTTPSGRQAK